MTTTNHPHHRHKSTASLDNCMNNILTLYQRSSNLPDSNTSWNPLAPSWSSSCLRWSWQLQVLRLSSRKLLKGYSKFEPPALDKPTQVQLGIYVNSIYSISEQTIDYSMDLYLRQAWRDPRLAFEPFRNISKLRLMGKPWDSVWVPDTFFRNI